MSQFYKLLIVLGISRLNFERRIMEPTSVDWIICHSEYLTNRSLLHWINRCGNEENTSGKMINVLIKWVGWNTVLERLLEPCNNNVVVYGGRTLRANLLCCFKTTAILDVAVKNYIGRSLGLSCKFHVSR